MKTKMKKKIKSMVCCMMLVLLWGYTCSLTVFAAEAIPVNFRGTVGSEGIYFGNSNLFPVGGFFAGDKPVYPGDSREQTLHFTNETGEITSFYLVMRVAGQDVAMTEKAELVRKLLYSNLLHLKITDTTGANVVYDDVFGGELGKESAFENKVGTDVSRLVPLGSLSPQNMADLKLTLTVDPKMGNDYQELISKVDWVIEARWTPTPVIPTNPTNPTNPTTPIPDNPIPAGPVTPIPDTPVPDEPTPAGPTPTVPDQEIPDEPIPLGPLPGQESLPKTGDRFPIELIAGTGLFCAVVFVTVTVGGKRKKG